ncbi:hypothetical protein CVT26_013289 [Gymnopilus dilepis]|uniref:Gylcosyl hydrolase 115 C-terminal domain-containing protein n=1 Tax=Gymnopilus dilepis TaxID=231916 RepID=A0A409VUN2_9AGAR|nr:hypothetical protein CVT26_013289 [Gymnopilus dilepis]
MNLTIFDDQDLAHITYNGTWVKGGTPQNFRNTLTSSTTVGDSFIARFNGDSIRVYTTIDNTSAGVITSYSADGLLPEEVAYPTVQERMLDNLIWQSPILQPGDHTLRVQIVKVNNGSGVGSGEGTVWFDYFVVEDPAATATATPSSQPSVAMDHYKRNNVAAIVGGTVAGMVVILAGVVLVFFRARRRAAKFY